MQTLQLELDEQTADRVQRLAAARQITPEELIRELVAKAEVVVDGHDEATGAAVEEEGEKPEDPFWGLYADIPDVMDQIVEEAMQARERYPFRASDG